MPDVTQLRLLPAASVDAILAAIPRCNPQSPEAVERLRGWLGRAADRAMTRSRRPVIKSDVDRLEKAYRKLCSEIDQLQDRISPPPNIRGQPNSEALEEWIDLYRVFTIKRGRPESSDWELICALLALYEVTSELEASAARQTSPTMRFLKAALVELSNLVPPDARGHFAVPNVAAVRQHLRINVFDVAAKRRELTKVIDMRECE